MEHLNGETPEFNKLVDAQERLDNLSSLVVRVAGILRDNTFTDSERECLRGFLKRAGVEFCWVYNHVEELKYSSAEESLKQLKNPTW